MARVVPLSELSEVFAHLRRHSRILRSKRSVHALDVGIVWKDGAMTDEIGIRAHVFLKRARKEVLSDEMLPRDLEGIRVDVVQSRPRRQSGDIPSEYSQFHDPLQGGIACKNVRAAGPGTLGAIVFDRHDRRALGLSCWHVLSPPPGFSTPGSREILQPPIGIVRAPIGSLIPGRISNQLDCALIEFGEIRRLDSSIRVSGVVPAGAAEPAVRQVLHKVGARTDETIGIVDGVNSLDFSLVPLQPGGQVSAPGDSGAVWYDPATNMVTGLHYKGDTDGAPERAWAKRATRVAEVLGIAFA